MASNVPRFTSFRPKPNSVVEPAQAAGPKVKDARTTKNDNLAQDTERRSHVAESEARSLYLIDRKGDPSNLKYGTIDRYSVPSYRRYGYGSILGDSKGLKIDRDLSTEKQLVLVLPLSRQQGRPLASKHATTQNVRSTRLIRAVTESQEQQAPDFIAISRKPKKTRESDDDSHGAALELNHPGLEKMEDQDAISDSDLEYESEAGSDPQDAEITQKNALLTQASRERPEDLRAWLDLIDHQEKMLTLDRKKLAELSPTDKRHLAEVKISVYEQAVRKIGKNADHQIKLQLGLLDEAAKFWEHDKLSSKWTDVLAKYPNNRAVWTKYLNFVQTSFATFKYEQCRSIFQRCLKAIQNCATATETEISLYVLVRMTTMIQQAGYQELALAIWQALLEFKLLRPPQGSDQDFLGLFEEFWDSEVSRIGESGAKGWAAFDAENGSAPPLLTASLAAPVFQADDIEEFRRREIEHMKKLRFPGRTADEVGEDDPFHMILFSDIEGCLDILPQTDSRELILGAFLCYCSLPPLIQKVPHQPKWWTDPLLCCQVLNSTTHQEQSTTLLQTIHQFIRSGSQQFSMTAELLFDHGFDNVPASLDVAHIRYALKMLAADDAIGESIGEYLLAFESRLLPSEVTKTAKQLLKLKPTSLRLYNAYGLVESRKGDSVKADLVFSTALSMNKCASPFATPGSLQLFSSWVWEALRKGNSIEALWRLVARGTFLQGRETGLLGQDYSSATQHVALSALLQYLFNDGNVDVALAVFNDLSDWFMKHNMSTSEAAELHAQETVKLITYHAQTAAIVRPALLRTTLESLIATFPNNAIFLATYAANERRFSIDDRVRGIVYDKVLTQGKATSISGWFFAIHYEMSRGELAGSTTHSVRALFKKAEEDVGAHCPGLWTSHVLFELEQAKMGREKRPNKKPRKDGSKRKEETRLEEAQRRVKETFFMGMQRLPWCKDFMMLAFTHLKEGILTREELRKVYNVMVEKELRLYVELEMDDK
ncbi:NRDE-2, necessary for RNA interference-domain-containing protein [Lophiotrema nucula]|uniref:NRDE-2, necessary for RNA interference-domain-containing protein n=1 Tax=Lophiotrema nucula TaxID=690887 RepID=A0A6A5ZL03_9PLEO|nr:NRDE-2, necessary for RNA interference-domain-containing protein [Lophiotrema nucula]